MISVPKLPAEWVQKESIYFDGLTSDPIRTQWYNTESRITVCRSLIIDINNAEWLRLIVSLQTRFPDHVDLKRVKNVFLGEHKNAYLLIPARIDDAKFYPPKANIFASTSQAVGIIQLSEIVVERGI